MSEKENGSLRSFIGKAVIIKHGRDKETRSAVILKGILGHWMAIENSDGIRSIPMCDVREIKLIKARPKETSYATLKRYVNTRLDKAERKSATKEFNIFKTDEEIDDNLNIKLSK